MDVYWEGHIINLCSDREKKNLIERKKKKGFELMWRQLIMQIEYSRYVRNI
jgi:hypothetical protein